jgi:deoxyribonucleoside regulator
MRSKSANYDQELKEMVRCLQLFYGQRMQQHEIALELNMHQSKVSRLLKRAFDEGLYTVQFNFPTLVQKATQLANRYGLRDAVVIPSGLPANLKEDLGRAAASYFDRVVADGARIGLSCGNTLFHMVQHLRDGSHKNLSVYPLAAETSLKFVDISFNTLVGMMTAKYRPTATGYALPAQLFQKNSFDKRSHQAFLRDPDIRRIFDASHDVDIAIVGIGELNPSSPGFCELAARKGLSEKKLRKMRVVGEFNYQPFDHAGVESTTRGIDEVMGQFIGVPIARLRELSKTYGRLVIAIAGGPDKRQAIQAALRGRLFNVLVTDDDTADALLASE